MSSRHVRWPLLTAALAAGAALVAALWPSQRSEAQSERQYPAFVFLGNVGLQVNLQPGTGQRPGTGNGTPIYLAAQLVRNPNLQPPFVNMPLPLAPLSASPVTAAGFSPGFSESCTLTQANTLLECVLTPNPAGNWAAGGPATFRVQLTSADGYGGTALVSFAIN